jgi:outer membrane protein assembly factor BamB
MAKSTVLITKGRTSGRSYFSPDDFALNNGRLNLKWKRFFGERLEVDMEPIVVGDTVFIGVMNGKFYALHADTGQIKWTFQADGPITDTPTAALIDSKLTIFFGSLDGHLYALAADTGLQKWKFKTSGYVMSTPTVQQGNIYFGSTDGNFYAINGSTGQMQWKVSAAGPITSTSAFGSLSNGQSVLFFSTGNNVAYAVETGGRIIWTKQMQGAFTKHTTIVYSNNVAIFMTRKPGKEYSEHLENLPSILQGSPQPGPTVLSAWADYYIAYPSRRPLYYFNAATGDDLWKPSIDKTKFTPLYIPYWGQYSPLVDNSGYAWLPSSGSGGDHGLGHDMRLWKINLSTGEITQHASEDQFSVRNDEVGRMSMAGSKLFQTISEDVAMYDTKSTVKVADIFGNGSSNHRNPNEFAELPSQIFGGMHKHFTRFGSSTSGGFAGANDATSPLVISGNRAFVTTWGHLYALTAEAVTATKHYDQLDLVKPLPITISKTSVKTQINDMAKALIGDSTKKHVA